MRTHLTYTAIIAGLAIALFFFVDRSRKLKKENDRQESVLREKTDSLRYTVNKLGQVTAEKAAAEVDKKQLQEYYGEEIKQIREELNVKDKNLRAFVKAEFAAQSKGTTTIVYNQQPDSSGAGSVERGTFSINDGYLLLDGILDSTKLSYNYTYQDEFLFAFHVKKKNLFSKEQLYGTGRLKNPNAVITNSTSVLVTDYKDKRWVVAAGVSWAPFSEIQFQPTITVGRALFKF